MAIMLIALSMTGTERYRREKQIARLAERDPLTALYNRRALEKRAPRLLEHVSPEHPGALLLIDIDNFKKLNDSLGHAAGDQALKALAATVRERLRPADHLARFGGEEFVVLLPDTGINEAVELVQRLQRELTKNFYLANQDRLVVTFSAGVALWHLGECDTDVIERADSAMYRAKLAGKNRTLSAETP